MPRAGKSHTGRALCAVATECCLLLLWKSPQPGINRNHHKPPSQPCRSPQCRLHHSCYILQRLYLTLQCPMACPGLATHTLAGLCALRLLSTASSSENLHKPAKPQPPQTTCHALPQSPVQAQPQLLHAVEEAAFYLAVPHCVPRAGKSHTGRALCAVVVAQCCLLLWKYPHTAGKTTNPTPTAHPCCSLQCSPQHA